MRLWPTHGRGGMIASMKMDRRQLFGVLAGLFVPVGPAASLAAAPAATVFSLTDAMCKFPIGDPRDADFAFCGRDARCGPYCGAHARLAYQPPKPRRVRGGLE